MRDAMAVEYHCLVPMIDKGTGVCSGLHTVAAFANNYPMTVAVYNLRPTTVCGKEKLLQASTGKGGLGPSHT